jgi:hypothetical protein
MRETRRVELVVGVRPDDACPSLAGAGEDGRRPGEGCWGKTNHCARSLLTILNDFSLSASNGEGRGEVSKLLVRPHARAQAVWNVVRALERLLRRVSRGGIITLSTGPKISSDATRCACVTPACADEVAPSRRRPVRNDCGTWSNQFNETNANQTLLLLLACAV